jgi:hypothetical protein
MNYSRLLLYSSMFLVISIPLMLHYQYAYGSNKLVEVNYLAVKEDHPDYMKRINLLKNPIINASSMEKFISEAIIEIFNYSVGDEQSGDYEGEKYFTKFGLSRYKESKEKFNDYLESNGVVLVNSVIDGDIYLTGIAEPQIGNKQYRYDLKIITTLKGLGGKKIGKKSMTLILKEDGVINNKYGIAIDSYTMN